VGLFKSILVIFFWFFADNTLQIVAMTGNTLSQSDLPCRLYMVAIILSEAAEGRREEQANSFTGDLRAMMRDLKIHLDEGFTLTNDQKVCPSPFITA
jgi:hypothetical protein